MPVQINSICISPPLINSSCAWSSDLRQLQDLYHSPYTGAVTTRTAVLDGFEENESHTVFFTAPHISSINSYGYSPYPLEQYLTWIEQILTAFPSNTKPFIISITASTPDTLSTMLASIQRLRHKLADHTTTDGRSRIAIELNTSCPNIPGAPPPAYVPSSGALPPLLSVLQHEYARDPTLTIGLKLPPFVHHAQFVDILNLLKGFCIPVAAQRTTRLCPFAFFTCTNTLGGTLAFDDDGGYVLPTGTGGTGGDALHALALGNVHTFSRLLRTEYPELAEVVVVGVGGVTSRMAVERMRRAGAEVVGCATFFGKEGVEAFKIISEGP